MAQKRHPENGGRLLADNGKTFARKVHTLIGETFAPLLEGRTDAPFDRFLDGLCPTDSPLSRDAIKTAVKCHVVCYDKAR